MAILRDAKITRHRKEDEGIFHGEAPLVDQELGGPFAGVLKRFIDAVLAGSVRNPVILRLGNRPTTGLTLDQVDLDRRRPADLYASA